jgi:hypothetical protein
MTKLRNRSAPPSPWVSERGTSSSACWTVAAFLLMACFGRLISLGDYGTEGGSRDSGAKISVASDDPREVLLRDVKLDFNWSKSGFGSVMVADFVIRNPTQYRFKDFEIKCTHLAPSGTVIDSNTRTIYEIVQPKSTKVIKGMNMGLIHSQVASSGCGITDLVVVQ